MVRRPRLTARAFLGSLLLGSVSVAGCASNNSFVDPLGFCNDLTRSEVGVPVSTTHSQPLDGYEGGGSCSYAADRPGTRRLALVIRRMASPADANAWLVHDSERFGVEVQPGTNSASYVANDASTGTAVHGRFAVSIDDVGHFTHRTAGDLEVLARAAARRADDADASATATT
ncbi:MAG: hypothetical protein JWM34_661 [Ilumatobacteraceae bacterium]|nr:hypothetical protein [Ilumatobacteraceae bacterium]